MVISYKGYIKRIIFERGSFKIAAIKLENNKELIIQGTFQNLDPLFEYEFIGTLTKHPKYGDQLQVEAVNKTIQEVPPTLNQEEVTVKGYIKRYLFEDKETSFKIAVITLENQEEFIIKGSFPILDESAVYEFSGLYEEHSKFGLQLNVTNFSKSDNQTKESIISYLKSDNFKGIGEITATKIYEHLGIDCLKKILDNYRVLLEIPNFKEEQAKNLQQQLALKQEVEQIYITLFSYGLSAKMIESLLKIYEKDVLKKIKENPYKLCYEVKGFSFIKCDELAKKLGILLDDIRRINEGIMFTIENECYSNGHIFITKEQLYPKVIELLNNHEHQEYKISQAKLKQIIDNINLEDRLIIEENRLYEKSLYEAEKNLSEKLLKINNTPLKKEYDTKSLNEALENAQKAFHIDYDSLQKDAIFNALTNKASIITGGPGTGKTTIIKAIIHMYKYLNKIVHDTNKEDISDDIDTTDISFVLAAPTGRAAKRLSETTNHNAFTIHRALKYNRNGVFEKNEDNKILTNLLIVDEFSMVDIKLANCLFKAIKDECQIIIVGDVFQLPSVGPGFVLSDLINADIFKVVELKEVQRQAKDSDIISLSTMIKNNSLKEEIFTKKKQVYFYEMDEYSVVQNLKKFVENFLNKGGNLQQDLQILAPMYKGSSGIDVINEMIQQEFNSSTTFYELKNSKRKFKVNDKVLQLSNEPELGIMNGDMGIIKAVDKNITLDEVRLLIDFDGKIIDYPLNKLDDLTLGYAISIHKSQGSEYKNVIMPVTPSYYIMLKRNIYYTGITRAKEKLILIGKKESFKMAINNKELLRQTSLLRRLREVPITKNSDILLEKNEPLLKDNHFIYINDPQIPFKYLGEQLNGLTPYDFMKKN